MAKGVEDTAFYRWHRLVALNEVGGDPGPVRARPTRGCTRGAERQQRRLAARHDGAVDPRHQAHRGRPGPAARVLAETCRGWATRRRSAGPTAAAARRRRVRPRTCSGRPSSAPGRSTPSGWTGYCSTRRCARPSGRTTWTTPDLGLRAAGPRRLARAASTPAPAATDSRAGRGIAAVDRATTLAREAGAADHARRARRLPGQRAGGPLPGRPRQPRGRSTTRRVGARLTRLDAGARRAASEAGGDWSTASSSD